MIMTILLVLLTLFLAAANGANDVSKGIATLVGSGVSNYRRAVIWGSIGTFLGAVTAGFATQALVGTFSGRGIVAAPSSDPRFLLAVAIGAIGWLVIATRTGLPVSTTHSLIGALIGAGIVQSGPHGITWSSLGGKVVSPLLISPVLSLLLVLGVLPLLRPLTRKVNRYCVCIEQNELVTPEGITLRESTTPLVGEVTTTCATSVARVTAIDTLHWISAGATTFFRGLNDTPKILALAVGAAAAIGVGVLPLYVIVAAAMAAGSVVAGFRVTETLAEKVTPVTPDNGFVANIVTALLVGLASRWALPVSTTHVSSGAIVGVGVSRGGSAIRWKTVGEMLLAWAVTLPVAALIGGIACKLML